MGDALSRKLRAFIIRHFTSTDEIEVLLLLWRQAARWWRAAEVAAVLHLLAPLAQRHLEQLSGRFLEVRVTEDVRFRFAPNNARREALTSALASAYQERRMEVASVLLSSRAARQFADAFRLKRGETDE